MATITLKVRPVVFRWIDNNFPKHRGKYDVRGSFIHPIICAALVRGNKHLNPIFVQKLKTYQSIELIISGHWVTNYGSVIIEEFQIRFNALMYAFITNEICTTAMNSHVYAAQPKTTIMRELLILGNYNDNELTLACICKIYQRKYLKKEKELRQMLA